MGKNVEYFFFLSKTSQNNICVTKVTYIFLSPLIIDYMILRNLRNISSNTEGTKLNWDATYVVGKHTDRFVITTHN
jgi:hypothetical protein